MTATRGAAEPDWPTTVRARKRDGRVQGTDGSVWLYRSVPLAPVADAPDELSGLEPGGPILAALDELAAMTGTRIARRSTAKSGYRQVHLLLVNVPRRFTPDPSPAGAAHLAELFPDRPGAAPAAAVRGAAAGPDHRLPGGAARSTRRWRPWSPAPSRCPTSTPTTPMSTRR